MGDVVSLSEYRSGEVVSLLRALVVSANAGDVFDVEVRVMTRRGEVVVKTGYYRRTRKQPSDPPHVDAL